MAEEKTVASGHNYSIGTDKNGHYEFTLGNLSDAGWFWEGKEDEAIGFLVRIGRSNFTDQFVKDIEKELPFSKFKPALNKALKKNDGLYQISGDNNLWTHGGIYDVLDTTEEVWERVENDGESEEEAKEQVNEKIGNMKAPYEGFEKEFAKQYKQEMGGIIAGSASFGDFLSKIDNDDFRLGWLENVDRYAREKFNEAKGVAKRRKKLKA